MSAPSTRDTALTPAGVFNSCSGVLPPSAGCGTRSQFSSQRSISSVAAAGCVDSVAIVRACASRLLKAGEVVSILEEGYLDWAAADGLALVHGGIRSKHLATLR